MSFNYPRILNLIWDSSKLTFLNYLTIVSFKRYHIDWDIHIYYTTKTDTKLDKKWSTPEQKVELEEHVQDYWSRVSEIPGVKMICVDEFIRSLDLSALHPVQQSDIIRIYVLYTYGGVYSDFDVIYLKNIEDYFLPYGESNLLFFGLEPNGYIYFPVGFFISKPQQECYKQILRLQLSESKNAESLKDYQYFGAALFRRLKSSNNSLLSSFRLLPSKCYLPVCWFEIEKKLYGGGKHCPIDTDSFAVHWFNGSSTSKKYINNFRNLEYTCPSVIEIKCTMDYLVSGYIKELTSATGVENVITPPIPAPLGLVSKAIDIEAVEQSREPKISIVMAYINRYRQLQHTLNTISKSLYKNIEVIIVDDGSIQDQRLDNLIYQYDFEIILTRVEPSDKKWVNPCIPYNIALSKATGDIIIIQNPEVCHVGDIIQYCRDNITDNKYLTFSVISSGGESENEKIYNYKDIIPHWDVQQVFTPQSWYNHPTCRNSQFHFLSCMTRNTLSKIGGFNENFRNGLSYDDDEFITRLRKVVECVTLSPEVGFGIHLWHPGGSIFYDTKVDLLQTLVNINSQLHRELVNSSVLYYPRGDCSKYTTLNNKNVIVFGGTGMLGRYVTTYFKSKGVNVVEFNREHIDVETIADISPIENLLLPHIKPNTVIVNCIGKIPQKMDNTTNNLKTFTMVNTLFPRYLSIIVEKFNHSRKGIASLNQRDELEGSALSTKGRVPPGIACAQSSPLGSIIEEDCTIRMFKHPDGSNQVNIIFKPGKYNINKLFQPLKRVFKSITKTNFLISYTERRQVTESYNILVKKNGKNPNMVFNKPYNLTREHISDVFNPINQYLLFPKLDGVRYLLYFIDSSSYLLNYTDFLKLSDDEDSDLDNTLLDGELIDNIYYPFDVLYCKGEDVRRKTRLDRLSYLEKINTPLKLVVIPPEKDIQLGLHKYFYNSNNPTITGLKDVFPPLDGVILTSNITSYNNNKTLKYKPHTHQVIDFEVKYDGAGRGVLYVKDYNGGLTIFRGSDKYPYNTQYSHIKLDKYTTQQVEIVKKGGIVEFRWDQELKTFIPVRNRNDKLNPNFIEVAKIIWDEINDPVKLFPNNYARLNSPFCKEFILSENINNGSGLFHSILYSGSEKYRNMVPDKKESFVKTLRQNFTANLGMKDWLKIGDGNLAFSMYKIFFIDSFKKIYNTTTVESPRLKNNIYYDMFKSHSLDFFVETLLPEIFDISLINRPFPKTPRYGDIPPIPESDSLSLRSSPQGGWLSDLGGGLEGFALSTKGRAPSTEGRGEREFGAKRYPPLRGG